MSALDSAITDALDRLGDLYNRIWTRDEIGLYYQDGYDRFARSTGIFFDIVVIENLPPTANWQKDLEVWFAQQRPGWGWTDAPFHFTTENTQERQASPIGGLKGTGGSWRGPSGITNPGQINIAVSGSYTVPTGVPGGYLPKDTVEVLRVTYNRRGITPMGSQEMRRLDVQYERRQGTAPLFWLWDKDGLFFLRLVPQMTGAAPYNAPSGKWGTRRDTNDPSRTPVFTEITGKNTQGFGILRRREQGFPSGGPWGTVTRIHPAVLNCRVEVARLGRDLRHHQNELPLAYQKYALFYAMSQALRRDGPGQNMDLADHYEQRFTMGVERLQKKKDRFLNERIGRFGGASQPEEFALGDPMLPFPYGTTYY